MSIIKGKPWIEQFFEKHPSYKNYVLDALNTDGKDLVCDYDSFPNLTKLTSIDMFTDIAVNNSEFTEIKII